MVLLVAVTGSGLALWNLTPASSSRAAAEGAPQAPQGVAEPPSLASSLNAVQVDAAALPATATDPAAKAAALGGSVDAVFAFVRDQVRDEVYAGVLRGARGTLLAGAGNASDKSLLLASLLRARGLPVRFVRGHLAADRAAAIVDQMFDSVAKPGRLTVPPPQPGDPPARAAARALVDGWNVNADEVQSVLRRDGVSLGQNPPTPRSTLVAEASDHTWIEVQQRDSWTALDPTFRDAKLGQAFAPADARSNDLPAALAHIITIRIVADERTGSTITSHDVLRYRDSAAALNGTLVVLNTPIAVAPTGWTATPFIQIGDRLFSGRPFTANGVIKKSIGKSVTNGLSAVAEAFGSTPAPAPAQGDLAAVWIVVDFQTPDGHTETVRRAMLDRIGPAARVSHQEGAAALAPIALRDNRPVALVGLYACEFSTGGFPAGFAAAQLASTVPALRAAAPLAAAVASGRQLADAERPRVDGLVSALPSLLHASALAFYRASQASLELVRGKASADVWFYDAAPRLVITSLEVVPAPDGKTARLESSIDLRRNDMRVVSAAADGSQVVWANVLRGVLDGALEQTFFGDRASATSPLVRGVSTVAVFDEARAANARRLAVRAPDLLAPLHLPDVARARMQAALDDGRTALVTPDRALPVHGEPHVGWWQIDLATGETLGVLETGLHQDLEEDEEIVTTVSTAWTGPAPVASVWSIETTHGAIVATSEEAGLAAFGEELAKETAYMLRFLK
ncbi:MAG: transglutaminase domain-containing protein [Vicinamibacterales bacterium]